MKKLRMVFGCLVMALLLPVFAFSSSFESVQDGNWEDAETWGGGIVPTGNDFVSVRHRVSWGGGVQIGQFGRLTVENAGIFTGSGGIDVYGSLTVRGQLEATGGLENYGKFEVSGSANISGDFYNRGGSMIVSGVVFADQDFKNYIGATVAITGVVHVQGDLNNFGLVEGPGGMFMVCGDADHNGIVQGTVYICMTCGKSYEDRGEGTFILSCSPFPVTFASFDGKYQDGKVNLNWSTASESNSDVFYIERATMIVAKVCTLGVCGPESRYVEIGQVNASGNSTATLSYKFTDENPEKAVNFYRIRAMDRDGQVTYSKAIEVSGELEANSLIAFPNPNNSTLYIRIKGAPQSQADLVLYDIQGRKVWDKKLLLKSSDPVDFELPVRSFSSGTYILEYRNASHKLTQKVVFYQ